jgi:hypothetical protein
LAWQKLLVKKENFHKAQYNICKTFNLSAYRFYSFMVRSLLYQIAQGNGNYFKRCILSAATQQTPNGNQTQVLYSGPLSNAKAVFAVGTFDLVAEIWDGAGAFTEYSIDPAFKVDPSYFANRRL